MARKPKNGTAKPEAQTEPEQSSSEEAVIISKSKLRALISELASHQAEMDEIRGTMGATVKNAVNDHNVHKGVLALTRRLRRMDAQKRAEFLFHFDRYRIHMGWDAQADMFREDDVPTEDTQETPPEPAGELEALPEGVASIRRPISPEASQAG